MSFLSRLFGAKSDAPAERPRRPSQKTGQLDYKGFVIRAVPFKENGQFQTAGDDREGDRRRRSKAYRFVRADRSTMVEEVTELALAKGRLIIDEQGDGVLRR